ncbi:MAG: LuxR family transcriptional regulator [Acidaminococcaceae bacterium]|nr:LuxR family transcriptional regulator [Acidaminococcaceae bacterium]
MKKKTGSVEQWLQFIGKDKLQTFQDNFAKAYGVSMIFLDINGHPLTVGSQNSLFCFTIEKQHSVRCQENFQNDKEAMLKGEPFIHVCPFGITCLYVPVFFNDRLTAFAGIGGLTYENGTIPDNLRDRFHITSYSKEKTQNILLLLDSMLRLLNVNTALTQGEKKQTQEDTLPTRLRDDRISKREREIVMLLCKGYSNKQISQQLFISETTVKTHISNILAKLNLHDRMQIVVHYYNKNNGALPDDSDNDNNEEDD